MKFRRAFRILLISGAPLSACSSGPMIVSDHLDAKAFGEPLHGLPYYLPKAVLSISITGSDGSDASAKGSPAGMTAAPAVTPAAAPSASTSASKSPSTAPVATATASPQITVNVQQAAQGNPQAGSTKSAPSYKLTVTVGKPTIIPDPKAEYYLRYTPDGWSDDTLSLHVDANGLMQSAKGQSVDQTAGVGTALVQIAAVAAGFPSSIRLPSQYPAGLFVGPDGKPIVPPPPPPKKPPPKCELPSISKTFNYEPGYPYKQDDGVEDSSEPKDYSDNTGMHHSLTWQVVSNAKLPSGNASQWAELKITETLVPRVPAVVGVAFKDADESNGTAADKPLGILFRDWANWTIAIDLSASDDAQRLCHIVPIHHEIRDLLMPNGGNLFWENMERQPLINKQISLTVQNGMLTGVDPTRPSTVLAWIKLPLTIIQPIISAPFQALAGGSKSSTTAPSTSGN